MYSYVCLSPYQAYKSSANEKRLRSLPTYQRKFPKSFCAHNVAFSKPVTFVILLGFVPRCAYLDGAACIVHICPPRRRGRAEHCAEFILRGTQLQLSISHADSDQFALGVEDLD